jgi:prepilin-type N-terminal cleavage/methylation domain-containing protein
MNRRTTTKSYARTGNVSSTYAFPACAMNRHPRIFSAQARQAGFTVVEVLVAVVVFAVGLLAIAGMQTQSISQSTFSEQRTVRVTAVSHQAETLIRLPVQANTANNVTVNPIFEEANMCAYGGETCEWSYVDTEDNKPHTVRQRVTQDYPLPNLAMVELEVAPQHASESKTLQRTVRIAFVRSLRWN